MQTTQRSSSRGAAKLLEDLRSDLASQDTDANRRNYQRFFKERLAEPVGLSTAVLRRISNRRFREYRQLPVQDILGLCDALLASRERYSRFFAFDWADKLKGKYHKSDLTRFHGWLMKYVDNWGTCDHVCSPLGHFFCQYPDLSSRLIPWTRSQNRWCRRAAAVSLTVAAKKGELIDRILGIADLLYDDPDDLVQKGCGWVLKEASRKHQDRIFDYIMSKRDRMPRTTLRYAIEKMPTALRRRAMAPAD